MKNLLKSTAVMTERILLIPMNINTPAFMMRYFLGLWSENNPYELKRSIGPNPKKVRTSGRAAPRELVVKEIF